MRNSFLEWETLHFVKSSQTLELNATGDFCGQCRVNEITTYFFLHIS